MLQRSLPLCLASLLSACATVPSPPTDLPAITDSRLADVQTWAYMIQGPDLAGLSATDFDLVVIDYAQDGTAATAFSAAEIQALRDAREGRLVIAYMSLGEAEDYRFYWDDDWQSDGPDWLGPANPDWPGNYAVRYWDPEWQQLVVHNPGGHAILGEAPAYLDRILAAGFDGVFLDIVDGFETWGPAEDGGNGERPSAATDMGELLVALGEYARSVNPSFIVCQQNGAALTSDELGQPLDVDLRSRVHEAVQWISAEDVFYRGEREANNPLDPDAYRIALIDAYRAQGELVTVIDYFDPDQPGYTSAAVSNFWERAQERGWLPSTGPRALDEVP